MCSYICYSLAPLNYDLILFLLCDVVVAHRGATRRRQTTVNLADGPRVQPNRGVNYDCLLCSCLLFLMGIVRRLFDARGPFFTIICYNMSVRSPLCFLLFCKGTGGVRVFGSL